MTKENRKLKRIKTRFPVNIKIDNKIEATATLVDISEEGLLIETKEVDAYELPSGSKLQIKLLSPFMGQTNVGNAILYRIVRKQKTPFGLQRIGLQRITESADQGSFPIIDPTNYFLHQCLEVEFTRIVEQLSVEIPNQGSKVILLTSASIGAGVSTLSWWLATTLSMIPNTKVLFVDADLRKSIFEETESYKGLLDLISDNEDLKGTVISIIPNSLYILNAGGNSGSLRGELNENRLKSVMQSFREQFHYIIIDGLPPDESPLVLNLAKYSDGVLFVVESGVSQIEKCKETVKQIQNFGAKVLGALLNKRIS